MICTILVLIRIVEKNNWLFLKKYKAVCAARLFFLALISNFILFATTKASSEEEKNALSKISKNSRNNCPNMSDLLI